MKPLPRPVTEEQAFLAGICHRLDRLADLIDERLPGQARTDDSTGTASGDAVPVELREPHPGPAAGTEHGEPDTSPLAPRKRAAKNTKGSRS